MTGRIDRVDLPAVTMRPALGLGIQSQKPKNKCLLLHILVALYEDTFPRQLSFLPPFWRGKDDSNVSSVAGNYPAESIFVRVFFERSMAQIGSRPARIPAGKL